MEDKEKQIDAIKTLIDRDILRLYNGLCDSVKEVVNNLNIINSKTSDVDIEGLIVKYNECLELIGKIEQVYDNGYNAIGKVLKHTYIKEQEKHDAELKQEHKDEIGKLKREFNNEIEKLKAEYERAKIDAQAKNKVEFDIHNIERGKLSKEIKELKSEIDELNKRVKDAEAEADRTKLELSFKSQSLENYKKESAFFCDNWEKEIDAREKEKTKRRPKITAGKTAALPPSVIEEIIKLYCQGLSKHKTAKKLEGKATRNGNRKGGYAYGYVEGFLKFFYLLFGYSRRQNWIDKEKHRDLCVDKDSKIRMPKKTQEDLADEGEIETYTLDEINRMRERINLKNSNLALSFEIGYFMGLRISECFGLMWEDINFETKIMKIERQLVKPKGCKFWCLTPLKTPAAYREIDIPDQLLTLLKERKEQQEKDALEYGEAYKNKEVVKKRLLKGQDESLVGGSFINRAPDGSLFTSDSMKSWATKFEAELGIHFKYHNLRHTHASTLAALNCPIPLLTKRLGHEKIETTQQYYFGKNEISQEKLISGLNSL